MHPQFRQGVYVMHISIASFYHYFRSYTFAHEKSPSSPWFSLLTIGSINLLLVCMGSFEGTEKGGFRGIGLE
jgi:hypothetical protein